MSDIDYDERIADMESAHRDELDDLRAVHADEIKDLQKMIEIHQSRLTAIKSHARALEALLESAMNTFADLDGEL